MRHLLPLIVLFPNNVSYKEDRLAESRSQICILAIRRAGKVHFGTFQWESRTQTLVNSSNIERVFKRWQMATKPKHERQPKLKTVCIKLLAVTVKSSQSWNRGKYWSSQGSWKGVIWVLLADIFRCASDRSRWQEVPAQASGWAFLQELTLRYCTGASCQSSRQDSPPQAQPVLHNDSEI